MELVVVNGANAISRGVLSKLAGKQYQKIKLLDFRPYRNSVYNFQRALPKGVEVEKHQVQSLANLDIAMEGAQDVVYFTHDYFASTSDKNAFIQSTARMAKKHGIEKLIAVCPIEHELFWSEDKHTPLEVRNEAQQKALQTFDKMSILNTNLVFGRDSYLVHYMAQCAMAGNIPKSIGGSKGFSYKPISTEDLSAAVEAALRNQATGLYSVNGADSVTLNELLHHVERSVGKSEGSTKLSGSLGLSDFVEEFFTGITHDKNMGRMAQFLDKNSPNLEEGSQDFFKEFGLSHQKKLNEYFDATKLNEEDLLHPIFTNYKMVSLD